NAREEDDHENFLVREKASESENGSNAVRPHELELVRNEGAAQGILDMKHVAELVLRPQDERRFRRQTQLRNNGTHHWRRVGAGDREEAVCSRASGIVPVRGNATARTKGEPYQGWGRLLLQLRQQRRAFVVAQR